MFIHLKKKIQKYLFNKIRIILPKCSTAHERTKSFFPHFSVISGTTPPKGMVLVLLQKLASIEMKNCLDDFWAIWIFGSKYDNGALRALKALFPISDLSSSLAENAWKNDREELTKEMSKFVRTVRNSKTRRDPIDLNLGREPQLFFSRSRAWKRVHFLCCTLEI